MFLTQISQLVPILCTLFSQYLHFLFTKVFPTILTKFLIGHHEEVGLIGFMPLTPSLSLVLSKMACHGARKKS